MARQARALGRRRRLATALCLASRGFRRASSAIAALPFVDELGEPEPPRGHVRKHRLRRIGRCLFNQSQAIRRLPAVPVASGCGLALHVDIPPRPYAMQRASARCELKQAMIKNSSNGVGGKKRTEVAAGGVVLDDAVGVGVQALPASRWPRRLQPFTSPGLGPSVVVARNFARWRVRPCTHR
jgi:hypothetical protein